MQGTRRARREATARAQKSKRGSRGEAVEPTDGQGSRGAGRTGRQVQRRARQLGFRDRAEQAGNGRVWGWDQRGSSATTGLRTRVGDGSAPVGGGKRTGEEVTGEEGRCRERGEQRGRDAGKQETRPKAMQGTPGRECPGRGDRGGRETVSDTGGWAVTPSGEQPSTSRTSSLWAGAGTRGGGHPSQGRTETWS